MKKDGSAGSGPCFPQITIDTECLARRIFIACLAIELAFLFLDYHINFGKFTEIGAMRKMFNIAREDGFASWFASIQTLMAGLTLGLIWLFSQARQETKAKTVGWLVLTCFFLLMAVDDGIQGHERVASTVKAMAAVGTFDFFPSYPWQVLLLPLFGGLGCFMLGFLWRVLAARRVRILLLTACVVMAIAVGLDFVEGLEPAHQWNVMSMLASRPGFDAWAQQRFGETGYDTLCHFSKAIEETLEMISISILWYLFIRRLGGNAPANPRITFT